MGTPPEDDAGANEGAPEPATSAPTPSSGRVAALASRVDALLAADDDDDDELDNGASSGVPDEPPTLEVSADAIELDDLEEVRESTPVAAAPPRPAMPRPPIPTPGQRPPVPPPPRGAMPRPPMAIPPLAPKIPPPRASVPISVSIPSRSPSEPPVIHDRPPTGDPRPRTPSSPPPLSAERARRPSTPPAIGSASASGGLPAISAQTSDEIMAGGQDISQIEGGVEVGTATPNLVVDQPLEAQLESPTALDKALAAGDAGSEQRAEMISREIEAVELADPNGAALLAYELGELYETRLADEARAVKSYGRAINFDPSLRPNLWAIRRVFYRRALWPNLVKLIDAEVEYARDDDERADLLLEKSRIAAHQLNDFDNAREALDEAVRIAPGHEGALLELERVAAKIGDATALLDTWERLAEAVEQPARKVAYLLEVGRAAAKLDYGRAQAAFDRAAPLAAHGTPAERVARERVRAAESHGTPADASTAIDALAQILLAEFGPAGPGAETGSAPLEQQPDRALALRRELVALRRRQAQLARADAPAKAWEYLQQALALSPGESLVLADLTELAEELGRYDDLAELVQSWQAIEGDPGRAMVLSIRRADALLRGGQRDEARALLASLDATAPGFIVLTSAGERDALGRKDPADLAKTYIAAAHAAMLGTWLGPGQAPKPDPQAAATLFVQAAELLAYQVGTPEAIEDARGAIGKALEAVPDDAAAFEALTELDDVTGRITDALARLRTVAANADPEAKRAVLERAIRLARGHGELEAVADLERELVALVPSDLRTRWALEATLSQLGKDEERTDLLVALAAAETDPTRRGTALLTAARLRERAGAVEAATELYRQVIALWPDDTFARESLVDLLRAQERWTELVSERRAEARALADGPAARRALREAAWVLEVRQKDLPSAVAVYDDWLARMPEDRTALEGAARCRAALADHNGEVTARAAIAELEPTSEMRWLHARSLERAGQFDEAADAYRALMAGEPSVPAIASAVALGDIAAGRADTVMRVESTAAIAGHTTDARLGAAVAEDSGWMYALVLEDFDRAAQSFEAAIALEPTRRGALLGAALVAARRNEPVELAQAFEGLASSVQMPQAAAALMLRAAALAAANGDIDLANQRITTAYTRSPDDTSALFVVAETGTAPPVDAADTFAAVDPLLARAEILELRGALTDDYASRISWELDRCEALELAGRLREAGMVVASVLRAKPDDLRALTALRRMAKRAGDSATTAQAAYQLSRVIGDRAAKLELLREAASVFDGPGLPHNTDYALAAYRRIVQSDPSAREFDRLGELLRERADVRGLTGVITERLTWLEAEGGVNADDQMVPLLLERATVFLGGGDRDSAMIDLDALLERAPKNVEALRFRADLAINAGEVDVAVGLWKRYLAAETRPQRRSEIELQLSQVLAENVNDIAGAIEQLERVVENSPDDVQLRDRLLGLCMRANDFERAARELRELAKMRPTPAEKAREELRLALMLRDKVGDRVGARRALDRARGLDPLNLDVVRELAELLEPPARAQVLADTAQHLRTSIAQSPGRGPMYERLAQVNAWQADVDARWVALVAVEALATPTVDQRQVLAQGRQQLGPPKRVKLEPAARAALRGSFGGPLAELWLQIAPAVQVATGVDAGKLGFVRGDRIAQKKLGDKFEPLATALANFGIEEVDLYVSANRPGIARTLAADPPQLLIGADVATGAMPQHRFQLGRTAATLAEGVATLPGLRDGELEQFIVAALRAFELAVPPALAELVTEADNAVAERVKVLRKELGRKHKAAITALAQQKGAALADVPALRTAALAVGNRAGMLWAGDLAVALATLDVGKGGRELADNPSALELVAWSVSDEYLHLREALGIAIKGTR